MQIQIRLEKEAEFPIIYDLIKTAFETAPIKDGTEQDFTDRLRVRDSYIPELAFVAQDECGQIVGHIMLTSIPIDAEIGEYEALLLAPICVALEHRNKGIGAQLIKEAFRCARECNFGAVILLGDPAYYNRFGFKESMEFGIENMNGFPDANVLMCELVSGALDRVCGTVHFEV